MKDFSFSCGLKHITSSPHYPQSNGLAERMVKTVKQLLIMTKDPFIALLSYRATPLPWCGLSPGELLMGKQIRTGLPQIREEMIPSWSYMHTFIKQDEDYKGKQAESYNKHHQCADH